MTTKKILLGVTGSIAAYKSASLVRLLVKKGYEVQVVMTQAAHDFITPLTLATLSKRPVLTHFQKNETGEWNNHVDWGLWADLLVIAPASANTLAKCANGFCDNLLSAIYLSARCPVIFAPAMDLDMFLHPSTQENLRKIQSFQNHIIEPKNGELASGLVGKGRMAEPEEILQVIENQFVTKKFLNKKVLITAGGTMEALDPVRYITNHSSGKMGFALAENLVKQGAIVTLIVGKTAYRPTFEVHTLISVVSAQDMYEAVMQNLDNQDIIIQAAAVADYTPAEKATQKIKKKTENFELVLTKTKDIAAETGKRITKNQIHVGFALETNDEVANAQKKLESKNFDFIVLNSLQEKGAGFGHDTNKIQLIDKSQIQDFPLKSKDEVAQDILKKIGSIKKFE